MHPIILKTGQGHIFCGGNVLADYDSTGVAGSRPAYWQFQNGSLADIIGCGDYGGNLVFVLYLAGLLFVSASLYRCGRVKK